MTAPKENPSHASTGVAPQPRSGVDVKRLAIGPEDAFVLFRVDGVADPKQIALTTGLSLDRVLQALGTLSRLGAIQFGAESAGPTSSQSRTEQSKPEPLKSDRANGAAQAQSKSQPKNDPPPSRAQPQNLEAKVDELFARLTNSDFYAMLGVRRDADKAQIKSAYFGLISDVHPDKYYGQELGTLKTKLEQTFQVLTEAYETLTRAKRRAAYDATLGPEVIAASPPSVPLHVATPTSAPRTSQLPEEATQPSAASFRLPPSAPAAPQFTHEPHKASVSPSTRFATAGAQVAKAAQTPPFIAASVAGQARTEVKVTTTNPPPAERRAAASIPVEGAARLSRQPPKLSEAPPTVRVASPPLGSQQATPRVTVSSADTRPLQAGQTSMSGAIAARSLAPESLLAKSQARRYATDAEEHVSAGNPAAAANSLRLASSLSPSDLGLKQRLEEVEAQADAKLADAHINSARQHESSGAFEQAARLYGKAARGKSSGQLYVLAAQCLLKHVDKSRPEPAARAQFLRDAGELAKKATQLSPNDANAHLLLGEIYSRAGMPASAITQLEKAASLKPQDSAIQTGLTRLRGEKT